jgi:hypothetical protein
MMLHPLPLGQSGLLVLCLNCAQIEMVQQATHILDAGLANYMRKENLCELAVNH